MIGYYVHHHGVGHLRRMLALTPHLEQPVTVLSSLPPPGDFSGGWVRLAADDSQLAPCDVTAGGTLHWAPRLDPALARRTAQIVDWLERARPSLVVVDVSVEVAVLVRLAGVPVVVVAMPGERSDRPHVMAYDLADALLAPWPAEGGAGSWPEGWLDKTWHVGAFSRFDGLSRPVLRDTARQPQALLLWGEGGAGCDDTRLDRMRAATPGWDWRLAHAGRRLGPDQVWEALCDADVVVTHGGQNTVAEVAAARTPAVVVADPRPFAEQHDTVRSLRHARVAVGLDAWPDSARWPGLLRDACALGGQAWSRWSYGDGAARAGQAIDDLAARRDQERAAARTSVLGA